MAKNGFKILDSDMHVMEPPDLWERYIDSKFKARAPRGVISSVSVEPDEATVKQVIGFMSGRSIVFSTDYPHGDSKYPQAVDHFLKLPLSDEDRRKKILWDNCAVLRNSNLREAAPISREIGAVERRARVSACRIRHGNDDGDDADDSPPSLPLRSQAGQAKR
jgi:hypothetical protein